MFNGVRLGSLFGFPIRIHFSFLALLGVVLVFMGGVPGVAAVLLIAASVVAHELGHALVARHLGVRVTEIGLHFFGGAAQMAGTPRRRGDEIAIAAAGPAVSFALAGVGHGLAALTGVPLFSFFGTANLVLALFNLIPAFPSDGGRILRAWLAGRHGLVRATDLAVTVARVACVALIAAAVYTGSVQLALVALALWTFGTAERAAVRHRFDPDTWRDGAAPRARAEYLPPGYARPPAGSFARPFAGARPVVYVWRS
jgi:Zn-dependent protease